MDKSRMNDVIEDEEIVYSWNMEALHGALRGLVLNGMRLSKEQKVKLKAVDFRGSEEVSMLIDNDSESMCWMLEGCENESEKIAKKLYKQHRGKFIEFVRSQMTYNLYECKQETNRRLRKLEKIEDGLFEHAEFGFTMNDKYDLALRNLNALHAEIRLALGRSTSSFDSSQEHHIYSKKLSRSSYGVWL